jgi:hypothetical protein
VIRHLCRCYRIHSLVIVVIGQKQLLQAKSSSIGVNDQESVNDDEHFLVSLSKHAVGGETICATTQIVRNFGISKKVFLALIASCVFTAFSNICYSFYYIGDR